MAYTFYGDVTIQRDLQINRNLSVTTGTASFATVTASTVTVTDNSTNIATTAFVKGQNYITGNQSISLTGDASGSGTTSISVTLNTSGATSGSYGSSTAIPTFTVNNKGIITAASTGSALTAAAIGAVSIATNNTITATHTFNASPIIPTLTATDSSTNAASTAFVKSLASSATPLMDGTATVGTSTNYAREGHIHPTDTTRAPLNSPNFTGAPTAPTVTASDSSTAIATTAFVANAVATAITAAIVYKGTVDITAVPPATPSQGWLYRVTTGGTPNAGYTGHWSVAPTVVDAGDYIVWNGTTWDREANVNPSVASGANITVTPSGDTSYTVSLVSSPALQGTPTATTLISTDNTSAIATTAFVKSLNYAPLASPTFTGIPAAPTVTITDNSTTLATTAYVKNQGYLTSNQSISITGDASGSGTSSIAVTLTPSGVTSASYGSASQVATFSVNGKGLITSASNTTITPSAIGAVSIATNNTITATHTFNASPIIPTLTATDSSTNAASTAFVKNQGYATDSVVVHLAGGETITGTKTFSTAIISTVSTGTAPFTVSSTTAVTNLNADQLDGQHGSYYAPLNSPTLTGTPAAPTLTATDNSTSIATTAFVKSAINSTASARYTQTFNNTTDWGTASGGYYTITVTQATHLKGTSPDVMFFAGTISFALCTPDNVVVNSSGDVAFQVPSTPDTRFAGRVVIS